MTSHIQPHPGRSDNSPPIPPETLNPPRRHENGSHRNHANSISVPSLPKKGGNPPEFAPEPTGSGLGLSPLETNDTRTFPRTPQKTRIARMARVVRGAASAVQDHMTRKKCRFKAAFITLTYRPGESWEPLDISKTMKCYRAWLKRRGHDLHAVWVAELQKRGAVHYHIVMWLPKGITPPFPDKQGWWTKGDTQAVWAKKPVSYITKYATKGTPGDMQFPKGCRLYGCYGIPIPLAWFRAPTWLRELTKPGDTIKRRGPWYCHYESGWGIRTPWVVRSFTQDTITLDWLGWPEGRVKKIEDIEANWTEWADIEAALRLVRRDDAWLDTLERLIPSCVQAGPISHGA